MAAEISGDQWDVLQSLLYNHEYFCRHIVKIEPKDIQFEDEDRAKFDALWRDDSTAGMIPYIKRPGQQNFRAFFDQMMKEVGYIAGAVVKPRQVGWSTEIQSEAYHEATKTPGLKVLIVSHSKDSTGKFLRRIRKMCAAAPPHITPGRPVENAREIIFANNAQVTISTAGSKDGVRSDNAHFFHGSEETSWENEIEVGASIYPALSFAHGSRAYRETTSKGRNTPWHNFITETQENYDPATKLWTPKRNRWRVFFDPYHNDPRYQATPPPGWQPSDEAVEHARMYLSHKTPEEQLRRLYWRQMMISDLKALWMFKQEYPSSIDESFQSSEDTLYNPDAVYRAAANGKLNAIALDPYAPLIMGVDPARTGDRTVIVFRQGNVVRKFLVWDKMDDMQLVGIIARFLNAGLDGKPIAKCFIDYAIGESAASRLRELGFGRLVQAVHFGSESSEPRYANKRAEMFIAVRDWLGDTGEHVSIPNDAQFTGDILAIPDFVQEAGSDKIKLKPKEIIKKAYGRSPDIADAFALTFAYEVAGERPAALQSLARQFMSHAKPSEIARVLSDFDR